MKNYIINGKMRTNQIKASNSHTIVAGAEKTYNIDRFYQYCTGANVTGQQINGSGVYRKYYQFTGAAGVTGIQFGQRIKFQDSAHLNGQTITISAVLANSLLTSVGWKLYRANSDNSFGTMASPTRTLIDSGTFTVNNTPTRYSDQVTLSSSDTTGLELVFDVGAQTSGTWLITEVQLEEGGAFTSFEHIPESLEVLLCMHHFEKSFVHETAPAQNANQNNGELQFFAAQGGATTTYGIQRYMVPKFRPPGGTAPTVTTYNPKAANAQARDIVEDVDCSNLSISNAWDKGFRVRIEGNTNSDYNNVFSVAWSSSSEL